MKLNIIDDRPEPVESNLPKHLGGHEFETHIDEGAVDKFCELVGAPETVLDIGCGPGGMVELFKKRGYNVTGIDGDFEVERPEDIKDNVVIHDYHEGPWLPEKPADLGWSVEFVEHVNKEYMFNFLQTFQQCKYIIMTHALPGQPGWHHVNCQPPEYWVGAMDACGLFVDVELTNAIREASTMKERYIRQMGLVFKNGRL